MALKTSQGHGKHVVVAGGGPGGILAAIYLARRGYQVSVYDKRALPDPTNEDPLRAYNLALFPRGLKPARDAGLDFAPFENPGYLGVAMHNAQDPMKTKFLPNGKTSEGLPLKVMLTRAALVRHMVEEAQRLFPENITFHFEHLISSLDFEDQTITFESKEKNKEVTAKYDLLVGADGLSSRVREELAAAVPELTYTKTYNYKFFKRFHGVSTALDNPLFKVGEERVPGCYMHGFTIPYKIGRRKEKAMFLVHHNADETFSGVLVLENTSLVKYNTVEDFSKLLDFLPLPEDWKAAALAQMVPGPWSVGGAWVRCSQLHGPRVLLLGDAAHSTSPSLGQGANLSLEDSAVLNAVLERCQDDLDLAPAEFTRARLEDVHALVYFDQSITMIRPQTALLNKFVLMSMCHKTVGPALQRVLPFLYKSNPESQAMGGPAATEEFTGAKLRAMRTTWSAVMFVVGAAALGGVIASGRSYMLRHP